MKNKTAMNSLLEHLVDIENGGYVLGLSPREGALVKATILSVQKTLKEEYLKMEEEQLISFYQDGRSDQNSVEERFYGRNGKYLFDNTYSK